MKFHKVHGAANDFIVVDGTSLTRDWSALAPGLCDRHRGVGADGILVVDHGGDGDFRMRLFNADGGEAEMCGNGIRCTAKFVLDTGMTEQRELTWDTGSGPVHTEVLDYGDEVASVRVDMGAPRMRPDLVPVLAEGDQVMARPFSIDGTSLELTCVSMGNPHAVAFVASVADFPLARVGPQVEHHSAFPKRTNFEVAEVVAPDKVRMRVWERGVGETMACGTGACAVAVASRLVHGTAERLQVELPGGRLLVEWSPGRSVLMTGPAQTAYTGELSV